MNIVKACIVVISISCIQHICADKKSNPIDRFTEAAYKGDLETVKKMLDEKIVSIDDQSPKHYKITALIAALSIPEKKLLKTDTVKKKIEVAKYLLSLGANIDIGGRLDSIFDKGLSDEAREIKKRSAYLEADKAQDHLIWYNLGKPKNQKMSIKDYDELMDLYREMKLLLERADINEDKLLMLTLDLDALHEISQQ